MDLLQPAAYLWSVWAQLTAPVSTVPPLDMPASIAVDAVNPLLDGGGDTPTAPTHANYVSVTSYNLTDRNRVRRILSAAESTNTTLQQSSLTIR
ncbi:hypothetical protein DFH11DRAFT_1591865 [Phellopilus nigrolimitatus]|nr:hypothetical protein DFH11DRAFT_1591865 [Phellopilus nigrolimitatus]